MKERVKSTIQIREMKEEEKDLVAQLLIDSYWEYKDFFEESRWRSYGEELSASVQEEAVEKLYVALYKGEIIGTMQLFTSSTTAYPKYEIDIGDPIIRFLAIHPKGRGLGIAKRLLDEAVTYAAGKKASAIYLHTTDMMAQAISLYERYGFIRAQQYDIDRGNYRMKCYQYKVEKGENGIA